MMTSSLLEVRDLRIHFPVSGGVVRAVDGINLAIHAGETVGLVGESGCGKSTLGRGMLRLEAVTKGSVHAFDEDVTTWPERRLRAMRRRTSIIFQDPMASLDPRMTVGQSIAEPLFIHKVGDRRSRQRLVAELLERVGLSSSITDRRPHAFSGGQLQRIGIARALALNPEVVVADEAVSALDVSVQAGIINLMMDLQAERGLAYLFVAHDLKVVELISDRVAVMYLGRLVEMGQVDRLFSQPKHPYSKALLAAAPKPDPRIRSAPPVLEGEMPSPLDPPSGCTFHPRCPVATHLCRETAPDLRFNTAGDAVACHLVSIDEP